MTKLLEKAIAKARELNDEAQDSIASMILSMADETWEAETTDEQTRAAVLEGLQQARRGEFVPDAEIDALWKRHGV
jgi:predicted transcriptional regulator